MHCFAFELKLRCVVCGVCVCVPAVCVLAKVHERIPECCDSEISAYSRVHAHNKLICNGYYVLLIHNLNIYVSPADKMCCDEAFVGLNITSTFLVPLIHTFFNGRVQLKCRRLNCNFSLAPACASTVFFLVFVYGVKCEQRQQPIDDDGSEIFIARTHCGYLDFPIGHNVSFYQRRWTVNVCSHSITIAITSFRMAFWDKFFVFDFILYDIYFCRHNFSFLFSIFNVFDFFFFFFLCVFIFRRGFSPTPTTSFFRSERVSAFSVNFNWFWNVVIFGLCLCDDDDDDDEMKRSTSSDGQINKIIENLRSYLVRCGYDQPCTDDSQQSTFDRISRILNLIFVFHYAALILNTAKRS